MSAGICIMNQNAIALAADSAVTIGGGMVIHNSVNKLFALSRIEPVGAIIYAKANFMQTPVEIILKQYRKDIDLKKRYFDKLEDYVEDFIRFLSENREFFRFSKNEKHYILSCVHEVVDLINTHLKKNYNKLVDEKNRDLTKDEKEKICEETIILIENYANRIPDNKNFQKDTYVKEQFEDIITKYIGERCSLFTAAQQCRIREVAISLVSKEFYRNGYVGIAFAGYGKKEIYPTMIHIHLSGLLESNVKYSVIKKAQIDEEHRQSIVPLAQVDVMETFLFGMSNSFLNYIKQMIPDTLGNDIDNISEEHFAENSKEKVKKELEICTAHIVNKIIDKAQNDFFQPIGNAIIGLPMDELGMLAESMVNLTSLRRKVAIDSNSRTVGGPIDVAIISKGDGFIWSKRKHYFDGKINPQYFASNFGGNADENK